MSPSTVPSGAILKLSTRKFSTLGVRKAGSEGPSLIFLISSESSESKTTTAFCSYQERIMDSGKSLTPQSKASARARAICTAEQVWNAADIAEIELIEAVFTTGQSQHHGVHGKLLNKISIVISTRFGAIAAAYDKESFDVSALDRSNNLIGHTKHRIMSTTGQYVFSRSILEPIGLLGGSDHFGKIPTFDMLDSGPFHPSPGKYPIFVDVPGTLNTIGIENDCTGEFSKLFVLILPVAASGMSPG